MQHLTDTPLWRLFSLASNTKGKQALHPRAFFPEDEAIADLKVYIILEGCSNEYLLYDLAEKRGFTTDDFDTIKTELESHPYVATASNLNIPGVLYNVIIPKIFEPIIIKEAGNLCRNTLELAMQ